MSELRDVERAIRTDIGCLSWIIIALLLVIIWRVW